MQGIKGTKNGVVMGLDNKGKAGDGLLRLTRIGIWIFMIYVLIGYIKAYHDKARDYAKAKRMAYQDIMTGLYNRTAYAKDIAELEKQLLQSPEDLSLIYAIFDLNDLKKMNDYHGHGMGDRYIAITGQIIKKAFEKVGKCYRIGGDEFAVLIKDKPVEEYHKAVRELKKLMERKNEALDLEFSLAFGYEVYEAGKFTSLKELIDKADRNMYENKYITKEEIGKEVYEKTSITRRDTVKNR
ncbi:GGDEF domain-containing protein [Konateibacter massiliensis]|uniref:GGDEF domain-containing protein n=1 Tax=Konateibacter massiliensis TaxID=2002841 RepID=UPI000C14BF9C|nr:GGDEF domain-containing protein [Konateibacter massiliensis]